MKTVEAKQVKFPTSDISELRKQIIEANKAYRTGDAIISDKEYDGLVERLTDVAPGDELLIKIGHMVADESRKRKLPIPMASLSKIGTFEEYKTWLRLKKIPENTMLVITPKFDGMSICRNELTSAAITRGDGIIGQDSTKHLTLICETSGKYFITFGEVLMSRKNFEIVKNDWQKFGLDKEPKNPRNLISGKINDKHPNKEILSLCSYIRYGIGGAISDNMSKSHQLSILNEINKIKVQFLTILASEITEDLLNNIFHKWNVDFELDGIVVDVDNEKLRLELGRENSTGNPCFSRAFKGNFEETKKSVVTDFSIKVSKLSQLKPVVKIEPVELDGVTVSNCTAINARFVSGYHLRVGSNITIKRSGMVIPQIVSIDDVKIIMDKNGNYNFPYNDNEIPKEFKKCPSCGGTTIWNESGVDVICTNDLCPGSDLERIISFFVTMEIEGVSEGVCEIFYDSGYNTIEKIVKMSIEDMLELPGFAIRKAEKTYEAIHSKLKDAELSKVMHASGLFGGGLGSKKLKLLEHFKAKPTLEEIISIQGFSEKSAMVYLKSIDEFNAFLKKIPQITIKTKDIMKKKPVKLDSKISSESYVFTGVRRADLEELIISKGGKVLSGISKNSTCLVCKEKGLGKSKEVKAEELGQRIITVEELEVELGV